MSSEEDKAGVMGLEVVVAAMAPGYVIIRPALSEFRRLVELERIPDLLGQTLADWVQRHPGVRVRAVLPIVEDGYTTAVHVWFDGEP